VPVTAVFELLVKGGRTIETCWAVNKRQDNKLEKLFNLVGDLFDLQYWYLHRTLKLPVFAFKWFNLLKPTCYVMNQQFNIQQLYALPTLYFCVLYLSENKQRLVPLTALTDWFL
jgi:hypothetical protein